MHATVNNILKMLNRESKEVITTLLMSTDTLVLILIQEYRRKTYDNKSNIMIEKMIDFH